LRGKNGESVRNRGQFWEKCTQSWFNSNTTEELFAIAVGFAFFVRNRGICPTP